MRVRASLARSELRHVWTLRGVPPDVRRQLNLPTLDEGIDLIACTRHGQYWAIQSKFRSQRDKPLNRRELATFSALAFNTCSNIAFAVVAHTASKPISKHHLMRNTAEIGLDRWQSLNEEAWRSIVGKLKGGSVRLDARSPRPHQQAAISAAKTRMKLRLCFVAAPTVPRSHSRPIRAATNLLLLHEKHA